VSFGLFDFDSDRGELRRDGVVVKLAPQPARVLGLLVSRPGEIVSRDELRRELWGEDTFVDFERGLNFCITQARAALGDAADNPRFIQTLPRRGYRFIAPVAPVTVPQSNPEPTAEPDGTSGTSGTPGTLGTLGIGTLTIVALLLATWAWGTRSLSHPADPARPARIAVMPFANLTGDADADYLADALTDEVIMQLGILGSDRLAVIARTSAMRYRGHQKTVKEIGQELDVAYVVESSVRRTGQSLRLSSSIISVATQTALTTWEDVFDAAAAADAQQTYAAVRVSRRIAAAVLPDAETAAAAGLTADNAAWDAFLQASALVNRGTPTDVVNAIARLEDAVQSDPSFGAAWARLAEAEHLRVMMGQAAPDDAYPAAREAATRAIAASRRGSFNCGTTGVLWMLSGRSSARLL
jgi:DNA-binding winged helix-turn-helix (wHTH) protein/TolB-like protein